MDHIDQLCLDFKIASLMPGRRMIVDIGWDGSNGSDRAYPIPHFSENDSEHDTMRFSGTDKQRWPKVRTF